MILNTTSIQIIDNRKVISTLHLGTLERHDLHKNYVCHSSNNDVTAPMTSSITLDLNCEYILIATENENGQNLNIHELNISFFISLSCIRNTLTPHPVRPLTIRLEQDVKYLSANHSYDLKCEVTGSRPAPLIQW